MDKIPVTIEMLDDYGKSIFLEAFTEMPSSETNMHINVLGRGLYEYTAPPTIKWKDINVDFVNSITKKQSDWLLQWSYSFFTVFGVRKNIRVIPKDENCTSFVLSNVYPVNFEQRIINDKKNKVYNNVFKNEKRLKRHVLFEKDNHPIIEIDLTMQLSMDQVIFNR